VSLPWKAAGTATRSSAGSSDATAHPASSV
jgi:hypothetical protein